MADLVAEPWSAGYDIVHSAAVTTVSEDEAVMDRDLFQKLRREFGSGFIAMVGGLHYQFKPQTAVPPETAAVPEHNHDDPDALLIQT